MIPVPDISQTYPKTGLTLDSRFVVGEGNARDLSSDANTGTLVTGRAVSFDGTGDQLVGTGPNIASTGAWSVSTWVKSSDTSTQYLFVGFGASSNTAILYLNYSGNVAHWGTGDSSPTNICSSSSLLDGDWHHLTITISGGTSATCYIDGSSAGTATVTSQDLSSMATVHISGVSSNSINGSLSDFKIYSGTALSAAQVLEQYQNPELPIPSGVTVAHLVAHWPLCDYSLSGATSLNDLYLLDVAGTNNLKGVNVGTEFAQPPPCPQLGLMPSLSRRFFDGSNDWYTGGNGITQSSGLAISAWVIPFNNSGAIILETANGGSSRTGLAIHPTGKAQFQHYAGSGYFGKADDGGVSYEGKLMHIVGCYDGTGWDTDAMKLYVNGSEKTSTAINGAGVNGSDATGVGAGFIAGGSPDKKFLGHIVSIAVWGDDISAAEVTEIYNGGPEFDPLSDSGNYASSGDLSHYWKLNNAYTVKDLKGSKDLTRVGGTEMTTIPEGTTAGTTVFGSTEEKRADNAVVNLNGGEYVTIPHDVNTRPDVDAGPTGRKGWTLSVWAKMRNFGTTSNPSIFSSGTGSSRWYFRIRGDSASTIQYNFGIGSANRDVDEGYHRLADTEWHHHVIVLESDGTSWTVGKMWFDGARVQSSGSDFEEDISALGSNDCATTTDITIGGASAGNADWDGAIAYPRIYAQALVEDEIKLLYTSGLRVVRGL